MKPGDEIIDLYEKTPPAVPTKTGNLGVDKVFQENTNRVNALNDFKRQEPKKP